MTAILAFACLAVAVLLGRVSSRRLSSEHLSAETRDTIKLSLGLVATMSALLLGLLESAIARVWPQQSGASSDLTPDFRSGDAIYYGVQGLVPSDATQSELKAKAADLTLELAEGRALLVSRALAGVSTPLLVIVVGWLFLILFGFSVLAPRNVVATVALTVAAAAVSGAILLMLEFYAPFDGLIAISSEPMRAAISHISN
jgi:hypothetical protein